MKFHPVAMAVLALSAAAGTASAAALDISTGSGGFVSTPAAGSFVDLYTFFLPVPTTLTGIVSSSVSGSQDVDFSSIVITGPSGPVSFSLINPDPFEIWTVSTGTLSAGAYTLSVSGINSPTMATYSGSIAVASVPEPETYAMMLAGVAAIGFMVLRRRD